MSSDCIFCKIAKGTIPSDKLYEDDEIIAFNDINPAAPIHFLVVPREHIPTLDDLKETHSNLMGKILLIGTEIAREKGASKEGYREVINCGKYGGQEVFHVHMHILGGRRMGKMG